MLFVELCVFALLMKSPLVYAAFGFVSSQPTIIGLVICAYIFRPMRVVSIYRLTFQ